MKSKLLLLLVAGSTLLMPSCKKKDDPTPSTSTTTTSTTTSTAAFSAKVNGTSTNFAGYYYQAVSGGIYIQGGVVSATAAPWIQLTTQLSQTTGTYTVGAMGVSATYMDASNTGHIATSGTITITSIANNKISGTFSFSGNGATVTNGVFTDIPKM
jgi:hypothetical protein